MGHDTPPAADAAPGGHPTGSLTAQGLAALSVQRVSPITWLDRPAAHDYDAAINFLSLIIQPVDAARFVDLFDAAPSSTFKAKDILRAARLRLLPDDDPSVARELAKAAAGEGISPILLVRGDFQSGRLLQIADGYHRTCASYHLFEDEDIPARIVDA